MRTRSCSNLPVESSPNPTTSNPKRRNRRRSKQPFILEESPVDTMADQRTMAELLRTPTEGYAEAIVVPLIFAEQFELKHSLINMMTSDQFFGQEKDNPHDHIPSVKAVEEICVTCSGAHPYYQCLAAGGNTFLELRDNIQGYITTAAINYNQGNSGYRPLGVANQIQPPGFAQPNVQNNQNRFSQPQGYNQGNNFNQDQSYQAPTQQNQVVPLSSGSLPSNTIANPKGELKAITTRSGIVLDGPSVPIPPPFINPEEDERVEETLTDQDLAKYTIKVPPPLIQKLKPHSQRNFIVHQRDPLHLNIPYPSRMLKQKQQEKDEVQIHKFWQMFKQLHINITLADALILIPKYQKMLKALLSNEEKLLELANTPLNENYSAVILKKLLEKLRDPEKFLIPCGFSELKCKALCY
nr:reverse transcriptase domain-containing protein [Tanacetum cinerariifolium]